jgi:hypothetical protein
MDTTELEVIIRDTVAAAITMELEDCGEPIKIAETLRHAIRQAWKQGLESSGMPEHHIARLQFPI